MVVSLSPAGLNWQPMKRIGLAIKQEDRPLVDVALGHISSFKLGLKGTCGEKRVLA